MNAQSFTRSKCQAFQRSKCQARGGGAVGRYRIYTRYEKQVGIGYPLEEDLWIAHSVFTRLEIYSNHHSGFGGVEPWTYPWKWVPLIATARGASGWLESNPPEGHAVITPRAYCTKQGEDDKYELHTGIWGTSSPEGYVETVTPWYKDEWVPSAFPEHPDGSLFAACPYLMPEDPPMESGASTVRENWIQLRWQ